MLLSRLHIETPRLPDRIPVAETFPNRSSWKLLMLFLVSLTGCTTASGTKFTLFPESNGLMSSTLAARQIGGTLDLPRELAKRPLPPYRVEPGDVLLVLTTEPDVSTLEREVNGDKNPRPSVRIPSDQPVLPDGSINLGRFGRVVVMGKTVEEIQVAVRSTIQAQVGFDPGFISVRVATRDSQVFYVLGDVNNPGVFPLKGRETVLDAILAAGGLNDRASRNNIILTRPTGPDQCRVVLPVCYRDIVQLGDTTTNYQVMPGDRIVVPTHSMHERKSSVCLSCTKPGIPCPLPRINPGPTTESSGVPVAAGGECACPPAR